MGKITVPEHTHGSGELCVAPLDALEPSTEFVQSRHGIWLKKNWKDATFNFCYRGTYSPLLTDYLNAQTEHFAFVDIGANQGLYTLIAAQSEYCVRALAFEPVRKTFALLEQNIQANPHAEKISAFRLAVFYEVDARWSNPERLKQILLGYGFCSFVPSSAGKHYDVLATCL